MRIRLGQRQNLSALWLRKQKQILSAERIITGVIRDQNGKVLYKKGEVISDKDLSGMNFYVEGVIGKIPK